MERPHRAVSPELAWGSLWPCSGGRRQFSGPSVDSKNCFRGVKGEFVSLDWLLCVPLCTARPTGKERSAQGCPLSRAAICRWCSRVAALCLMQPFACRAPCGVATELRQVLAGTPHMWWPFSPAAVSQRLLMCGGCEGALCLRRLMWSGRFPEVAELLLSSLRGQYVLQAVTWT